MTRFYLRLILVATILFTALLLIIHAQPYDDHELRQLLLPEGCPAPCFMGIRPGVTTMDEAVKLLRTSDWVDRLTIGESEPSSSRTARITWIWSEKAPYLFKLPPPHFDYGWQGFIDFDNHDVVDTVLIETNIEFGAIWLLWNYQIYYRIEAGHGPDEFIPFKWNSWANYEILSLEYWIVARGQYACPVMRVKWEERMNLKYDSNTLEKYDGFYKSNNFLPDIRSRTYC